MTSNSMATSKNFAILSWLSASAAFLLTDQLWLALAIAPLGVFFWCSAGSFDKILPRPVDSAGNAISPRAIKQYRVEHPTATITEAIEELKKR